jgi:hypothetical protein
MAIPISTDLVEAARNGGAAEIERLLLKIWPDANHQRLRRHLWRRDRQEDQLRTHDHCSTGYRVGRMTNHKVKRADWGVSVRRRTGGALVGRESFSSLKIGRP